MADNRLYAFQKQQSTSLSSLGGHRSSLCTSVEFIHFCAFVIIEFIPGFLKKYAKIADKAYLETN